MKNGKSHVKNEKTDVLDSSDDYGMDWLGTTMHPLDAPADCPCLRDQHELGCNYPACQSK
jgi:hypothetical protein